MADDEQVYEDSEGERYTVDELRGIWAGDIANLISYRAEGNDDELSDEEFEERYSFESWLGDNGSYFPVEFEDEGPNPESPNA